MSSNLKDPIKSLEKDMKQLVNFFVKHHLFVKFNTTFTNIKFSYPGLVYIRIAEIYRIIAESNILSKLKRDIDKMKEHKFQLNIMRNLFIGERIPTREEEKKIYSKLISKDKKR